MDELKLEFDQTVEKNQQTNNEIIRGALNDGVSNINVLQATISEIQSILNGFVGTIFTYIGLVAPDGWLVCDGKTIGNISSLADYKGDQYKLLYDLLNEISGRWENSGTKIWANNDVVKLPNLQDAFLRFNVGNSVSIFTDNTKRGLALGLKQDDAFQGHLHRITNYFLLDGSYQPGVKGPSNGGYATYLNTDVTLHNDGTNGNPRTAPESRGKNINVNAIIKY